MNVWVIVGVDEVEKFTDVSSVTEYQVVDRIELTDFDGETIASFEGDEYADWASDGSAHG